MAWLRPTMLTAAAALLALAACSPTFDWRRVRPKDAGGAEAMFPCRPRHEVREVPLAGAPVRLAVSACSTGGAMFALMSADVGDPLRVGPALQALRTSALGNLGGTVRMERPAAVAGMTPQPAARLLDADGRLPDGRAVHERLVLYSKGTRVFQATVFAERLDPDVAATFADGLRTP